MKTLTNRNERRSVAPQAAAEVLRYKLQPVTDSLTHMDRTFLANNLPASRITAFQCAYAITPCLINLALVSLL